MSLTGHYLTPTSSLPPVRSLVAASEEQILSSLRNLQTIYCPLRLPVTVHSDPRFKRVVSASTTPVDSGYVSHDESAGGVDAEAAIADLRADVFERNYVIRWLTALIARVEELSIESESVRECVLDDAAFILSSFSDSTEDGEDQSITRDFSFQTSLPDSNPVKVQLNDAPLTGVDHTDVGLQSWGASIILSELLCLDPTRFGLDGVSTVVELGAGTGLVSLTLATLLPQLPTSTTKPTVIATDYHPAVLDNLRANITTNFPSSPSSAVQTALLDWSSPSLTGPLSSPVDMLIAADVIYAPEHAQWLRDCAARMLVPSGVFWLIATVRKSGKFEGIADTVEAAFKIEDCPRYESTGRVFRILEKTEVEKKRGIGRGDESGYLLFRIGWD
ncbi:hypothetical protein BU24DRAFT_453158 [Aaosphaeria arxii CBS 175.79]|uniref:S-adenosyl-L-methionine-dependent methyltransferase n=1 Tax=Aaosphaeria arxii CBS 175.79 TaxID=1450172 RepID=A0A6A5XJ99_9PLEO|nr:uncharacterized protein BU24DRAFT_453158 [Aaosphaeria arxii CBS 175.79]KAF2012830.1 hypothetical protein BU24DRAFT_453158 [Aaosphaeria arxii CBS 175.79]